MAVSNLTSWYASTDPDERLKRRRFGRDVRKLRRQYNMSRQELADNLNISVDALDRIERGCVDPDANNLRTKIQRAVTRTVMVIGL